MQDTGKRMCCKVKGLPLHSCDGSHRQSFFLAKRELARVTMCLGNELSFVIITPYQAPDTQQVPRAVTGF